MTTLEAAVQAARALLDGNGESEYARGVIEFIIDAFELPTEMFHLVQIAVTVR